MICAHPHSTTTLQIYSCTPRPLFSVLDTPSFSKQWKAFLFYFIFLSSYSCLLNFFSLFNYSCLTFPPIGLPCLHPLLPQSIPTPLSMPTGPLYTFLDLPLPLLSSRYLLFLSPLSLSVFFFISMSLVLFCSFVLFIRFHL